MKKWYDRAREKKAAHAYSTHITHECQRTIVFRLKMVCCCISFSRNCVRTISLIFYCSYYYLNSFHRASPLRKVWTLLRIAGQRVHRAKEFLQPWTKIKLIAVYWLWLGRSTIIFIVRSFTFMVPVDKQLLIVIPNTTSPTSKNRFLFTHHRQIIYWFYYVYSNTVLRFRQTSKSLMQLKLKSKHFCFVSPFLFKRESHCGNKSYRFAKFMPINLFYSLQLERVVCI